MKTTTIGLDIAKSIFHLVEINHTGRLLRKKQLKRKQLLSYFAKHEPSIIVMEACGGANYWAREFIKQGHQVKLIAPQYVKPFVKGNKNDYNDAQGIAEASQRPTMRFVPIKSVTQQDLQNVHRQRERIKKERTALVNQIRGLLAEYGVVIKKGISAVRNKLPSIIEEGANDLTVMSRALFNELFEELVAMGRLLEHCDKKIKIANKNVTIQLLG